MRQIAHSRIYQLSFEYTNPERAAWLMRDFLSNSIRKTNQTLSKNLFLKLKLLKVGFTEVEDIAEHMIRQQKVRRKTRNEKYEIVKDLMKHKMKDAEEYLKQVSDNLKKSKDNLRSVAREGTIVRKEFMNLVDNEINRVWKNGKNKNENKAHQLERKYIMEEAAPDMHLGVCVSDDKLDEVEVKMIKNSENQIDKPTIYVGTENPIDNPASYVGIETQDKPANYAGMKNQVDKPANYAGIEGITKDQEELLMMAPNHRVYSRLNLESFETELEKAFIKANWEKLREGHSNEERNKALETGDNMETLKTFDDKKKVIDFRNLKATDLKNNKRIKIPEFNDDVEEIRSNTIKTELKEVFIKYMKENCDEKGNMLEGNLTVEQVKAIKDLKMKMKNENLVCVETDPWPKCRPI